MKISNNQANGLKEIYSLYEIDENIKNENINKFINEWDRRPNLKIIKEWWNKQNISIELTAIGRVLGHSNAQKYLEVLPSFPPFE